MVQNRWYCISPNGGFLTQIKVRFLAFVGFVVAVSDEYLF
jgi:hypothetical protein